MVQVTAEQQPLQRILDLVIALLRADTATLVTKLLPLLDRLLNRPVGVYEVLDYEAQLALCDPKGKRAIYIKRQRVRFLHDDVIAFQDQAFGDGDIFAEYKCSPGIPVDRYQEGYRYRILISLRQTKNRGDIEEFHIERHIRNGFVKSEGSFQTNVDHKTSKLALRLIFPHERKPFDVLLVEQRTGRTTALGADHIRRLPDRNWSVAWEKEKPRLFESYILRWKW